MLSGDYNQSALLTKVGLQQVSLMVTGLHIRQLLQRFRDCKGHCVNMLDGINSLEKKGV